LDAEFQLAELEWLRAEDDDRMTVPARRAKKIKYLESKISLHDFAKAATSMRQGAGPLPVARIELD